MLIEPFFVLINLLKQALLIPPQYFSFLDFCQHKFLGKKFMNWQYPFPRFWHFSITKSGFREWQNYFWHCNLPMPANLFIQLVFLLKCSAICTQTSFGGDCKNTCRQMRITWFVEIKNLEKKKLTQQAQDICAHCKAGWWSVPFSLFYCLAGQRATMQSWSCHTKPGYRSGATK